eukprot:358020-Chlamydomonas_euryale.AAC.19
MADVRRKVREGLQVIRLVLTRVRQGAARMRVHAHVHTFVHIAAAAALGSARIARYRRRHRARGRRGLYKRAAGRPRQQLGAHVSVARHPAARVCMCVSATSEGE